jgi:hypothetical protein
MPRSVRSHRVFLSGVRSQAHAVYVAAWLRTRLAADGAPITVVDQGLGGFLGARPITTADLDRLLPDDPRITRISPAGPGRLHAEPGEQLTYVAVGAPGIKPWARLRAAHPARRIGVVVTDEGLGSYGDWRSRRDSWLREGGRGPWPTIRAWAGATATRTLTTTRWPLYLERVGAWTLNEPVAAEFRRTPGPQPAALGGDGRRAVYLTQPWTSLGVLDPAPYRAHISAVADACARAGMGFAVRPHPAEPVGLYDGWEVLPGNTPAELDPRVRSAAAVLGATSTALLNLAAIFHVPSYRVGGKELAVLDDLLSPRQRTLLDTFLPPTVAPDDLEVGR